jgi:eukaryotic-like serine/threonine-protein kinase
MAALDSITLAQQVVKLGLVTPAQLQECQDEVGEVSSNPEPLLRAMERKSYLTALQIDKLLKGDVDGYFLGQYRLLYKIASGSFGRVFRGDDPHSGRVVAIKVLRRRWSDDPQSVELFEREGRMGMSLRHDNIVEILYIGRDPKTRQYYFVMDFVEGGNLRDLLAIRKKFEPADALKVMEDVASGLAYAFTRGVTHRDIKLTNILISTSGVAKLVDFGLAQIYATTKGFRLGMQDEDDIHVQRTVDYAGLEKATGVQSGDTRSDIFFLGCVLYEILTGRPPLVMTRDKYARMRKDRFENIAPIKPDEINGPPSVIRLVENMMMLDPMRRFQTPSQLVDAIKSVRAEIGGGAAANWSSAPTIFVVESDGRLQDAVREKLKKLGYRVLLAANPIRAVERYNHTPYQGVVVDAGTTEDPGLDAFKHIMHQSDIRKLPCAGILIVSEEQHRKVQKTMPLNKSSTILIRPIKLGDLVRTLQKLVPVGK